MEISRESIFISAIRAFFNTLLGTIAVVLAFIPILIILMLFSNQSHDLNFKNKLEILPDLNGDTKVLPASAPCVLQVDIKGTIGKGQITSDDINYKLIESRKGTLKKGRVKSILLNINSRGGDAITSDAIYRDLLTYKEKFNVPVYTYIEGFCASGGYYIACASDKIYSAPLGIIGSVGVFFGPFFNYKKLMDKVGIDSKIISDGKNKLTFNPYGEWKENEGEYYQTLTKFTYNRFIDIVSKARGIEKDKLINEYGAKVFDTTQAKEINYIDGATSYNDALKSLLEKSEIDSEKPYQVVILKSKKSWLLPMISEAKSSFKGFLKNYMLSILEN